MSGGYRGVGLTQAEVDAITVDFRAAGGVVDQGADAQRYLRTRGAGGLTLNQGTILLPANPTRTAVYEELVHAEQFRRGVTIEAGRGGVLRFEAEAAEALIRNRHSWQLAAEEVRQVIANLRNMRAELQRRTAGKSGATMTRTIADKLAASVIEITDLGRLYPASVFKGRIGLDVRVERGSLSTGRRVRLHGPGSEEEVEIVGIEMLSHDPDTEVVRILCPTPELLTLPTGKVEGWTIVEP